MIVSMLLWGFVVGIFGHIRGWNPFQIFTVGFVIGAIIQILK